MRYCDLKMGDGKLAQLLGRGSQVPGMCFLRTMNPENPWVLQRNTVFQGGFQVSYSGVYTGQKSREQPMVFHMFTLEPVGFSVDFSFTPPKTNTDPENGTLKDCFPLQTSGFQGPF